MIGTRLAHYEVLDLLGRGGMGEVYRARDTKLGREVALKFLPEDLARDEERLARFEREAKVLASLQHPDIAAIFGCGFPAFRGGPLWYIDDLGAAGIVDELQQLAEQRGPRFAPAELLVEMGRANRKFYA